METQSLPYTRLQVILHWVVVALVAAQYATSGSIGRTHHADAHGHEPAALDLILHALHNWGGLAVGALMLVRLALRWMLGPSLVGIPRGTWQARLAAWTHATFYAVLVAQAATGAVASYLFWPASTLHVVLAWALIGIVALHVAGALWHLVVERDAGLPRVLRLARPGKAP